MRGIALESENLPRRGKYLQVIHCLIFPFLVCYDHNATLAKMVSQQTPRKAIL